MNVNIELIQNRGLYRISLKSKDSVVIEEVPNLTIQNYFSKKGVHVREIEPLVVADYVK